MTTREELLKVLDMGEDEQHDWCARSPECRMGNESLPDLAFRLRDEVCKESYGIDNYRNALIEVYSEWDKKQNLHAQTVVTFMAWLVAFIEPIDRIIAALITKENQ